MTLGSPGGRGGVKPPHSLEAEREVLSAVFIQASALKEIRALLKPEDFYIERHRVVLSAMLELDAKGVPVDLVLMVEAMKGSGALEKVGGVRALTELLDRAGTVTNVRHYAHVVKKKSLERAIVSEAQLIHVDMLSDDDDARQRVEQRIATLALLHSHLAKVGRTQRRWDDAVYETVERGTRNAEPKPRKPFGIPRLDEMLNGGVRDGSLVVINALSGGGKTALAVVNLAFTWGEMGLRVLIVSLEMGDDELAERAIARETGVEAWRLDQGKVHETRFIDVVDAGQKISEFRFVIEEAAGSMSALEAAVMEAHEDSPLDGVIVDYVQLMDNGIEGEANIAKTSRGCKLLAKKLGLPVVLLTQSTVVVNREGKAPKAADGKGSGALQADADVIIVPQIIEPENGARPDVCPAEIYVRKQRKGKVGKVGGLVFDGPRCMFREPTEAEKSRGIGY